MNTLGINERKYYDLERGYKKAGEVFHKDISRFRPRAEKFRVSGAGVFRAPARPTFGNSAKSRQKHRKEPRFLHLLARYAVGKGESACRTFAQIFLFRCVKGLSQQQRRCRWLVRRTTLSVLPLQRMSGSGAKGKSVRHTARQRPCSVNAWYRISQSERYSVGGFLNRRFKQRFWVLLPLRAKVPRGRNRETPLPENTPHSTPR